jgi:hypothetical protein
MSPAETVRWFGYFERIDSRAEANHAAPPAGTCIVPPLPSGASTDWRGGSRLPWKSLNAMMPTSTGPASVTAGLPAPGPVEAIGPAQAESNTETVSATAPRRTYVMGPEPDCLC